MDPHCQITNLKHRMLEVWPGSQNELALATGINQGKLSRYCTGQLIIPAHHLMILADVLSCNASDLIGFREMSVA